MASIPSGTKFLGVSASVDTKERRSSQINNETEYYTLDSHMAVADGSPIEVTKIWSGSQAQYDALGSYSNDTLYIIV